MDYNRLYKKYLLDDMSAEERAILAKLLLDAEENELWDIEEVNALNPEDVLLNEEQTAAIYENITGLTLKSKPTIFRINRAYAVAAALLIGVLLSTFYFWKFQERQINVPFEELTSISNPTRFVKSVQLYDGSTVLLKQGARLAILSDFEKDTVRRVKLEGEAFFDIAKNPKKAFCVIESGAFDVRVLGTAFHFINLPLQNNLVLTHGKVQVSHGDQAMLVAPGEGIVYNNKRESFEKSLADTVASSLWTYSLLSFEKEPVAQIVADLNSLYPQANLVLHENYKGLIFTGYLPSKDLEKSIAILNKAFNNIIISKR